MHISLDIFQYLKNTALSNKKDSEPFFIKNWQPISLLNCDHKTVAKATANHLKRLLPKLIDHDQTGFLKGFIGENIRLVDATIKYTATSIS